MDITQHKIEFHKIISKYSLDTKAGDIADYLTRHTNDQISLKEFSDLFNMEQDDAKIFLSFVEKGIKFKEEHIDRN